MKNEEYWKERALTVEGNAYNEGVLYAKRLEKTYRKAIAEMERDIEYWYGRIAENNDISIAEARKMLDEKELEEFGWTVEKYIEKGRENAINQEWLKELENASAKAHITRLQAIEIQLQQHAETVIGELGLGMGEHLANVYTNSYLETIYGIQKGIGYGFNAHIPPKEMINKYLKEPWAKDGKNFSERVWGSHRERLVETLKSDLVSAVIRGEDPRKTARLLARDFDVSLSAAKRLVLTETAAFSSMATKDGYEDTGVEKFEILATLDKRTCEACGKQDGKAIDTKEYKVGGTAPPFHVNCRCTTVPYFDDMDDLVERAARDENGKSTVIGENITFEEWKERFVKNDTPNAEKAIEEKKSANKGGRNGKFAKYEKGVENSGESGIIKSSGALNPTSDRADKHAESYYNSVRKMKNDYKVIAKNTGYTEEEIYSVKKFIFLDKHILADGRNDYFDPSYEMAQSWQRLIDGRNIQPHDLTLLKHELMEKRLIEEGMAQADAHLITSKKYNYTKESNDYYDNIKKHKKEK